MNGVLGFLDAFSEIETLYIHADSAECPWVEPVEAGRMMRFTDQTITSGASLHTIS